MTNTSVTTTPEQASPIFRFLLGAGGLVLLVAGLRAASDIINPFLLALIFAFTFGPMLGWLRKKGLPAWLALLLTLFLLLGGGIILLVFLGTAISELIEALPSYQSSAEGQSADLQASLANSGINAESVLNLFNPERLFGLLGSILAEVISAVAATGFMLFILAFMLFETIGISKKLRGPQIADNQFIKRFTRFGADIRQYVLVLTWINFLVGLGDALFLYLLGVDFPILWGLLAWFMGYIPSIGFWFALIPPFLLAYAEFGIGTALLVLLGYVLINGTVQNVIQPKLMGDRLNMSPLVIVASLFIWTWVLGPIGALIAVPMSMAVQQLVLGSSDGSRWLADLMGAGPPAPVEEEPADVTPGSE
jgi:predicted PurR-regulated permease PerM